MDIYFLITLLLHDTTELIEVFVTPKIPSVSRTFLPKVSQAVDNNGYFSPKNRSDSHIEFV